MQFCEQYASPASSLSQIHPLLQPRFLAPSRHPHPPYATLFPFLFFFGTSFIVRPITTPNTSATHASTHSSTGSAFRALPALHIPQPKYITNPPIPATFRREESAHTRRQTLLQLIRLVRILQNERVQEAVASDLELDLLRFAVAFYARGCFPSPGKDQQVRTYASLIGRR